MEKGDFIVVCNADELHALRTFWMGDNPRQREAYQVVEVKPSESEFFDYVIGVGQIPVEPVNPAA